MKKKRNEEKGMKEIKSKRKNREKGEEKGRKDEKVKRSIQKN